MAKRRNQHEVFEFNLNLSLFQCVTGNARNAQAIESFKNIKSIHRLMGNLLVHGLISNDEVSIII